jgi:hypothetical protein
MRPLPIGRLLRLTHVRLRNVRLWTLIADHPTCSKRCPLFLELFKYSPQGVLISADFSLL